MFLPSSSRKYFIDTSDGTHLSIFNTAENMNMLFPKELNILQDIQYLHNFYKIKKGRDWLNIIQDLYMLIMGQTFL